MTVEEWRGVRNLRVNDVDTWAGAAGEGSAELGRILLAAHAPPAGAYAIFNHLSHFQTRTEDFARVARRLLVGRSLLTDAIREEVKTAAQNEPYGHEHQRTLHVVHELSTDMRLDFESLYLFGTLTLDQLAHVALRIGGLPLKGAGTGPGSAFTLLVKWLENGRYGALDELWVTVGTELVWVKWQMWFFRNQFVVHADRPWQRGSNYGHTTDDFSLFIPAPIGWNDNGPLLRQVADTWAEVQEGLGDPRAPAVTPPAVLLDTMFDRIDEIPRVDRRQKIGELRAQMGGTTPTFQIVAGRTLLFLRDAIQVLLKIAAERADEIDLGNPHTTQDELMRRYRADESDPPAD